VQRGQETGKITAKYILIFIFFKKKVLDIKRTAGFISAYFVVPCRILFSSSYYEFQTLNIIL